MTVVTPAGLPILEAARWVGASCWLELQVHGLITEVLASEGLDDDQRVALWRVRSNRAEVAEAWHRRLPELREFPRETFVGPLDESSGQIPYDTGGGISAVAGALSGLRQRYEAHAGVAVGPADGPVAATLRWALGLLAPDLEDVAVGAVRPDGHPGGSAP